MLTPNQHEAGRRRRAQRVADEASLARRGLGPARAARRRGAAGHARRRGHEPVRARRPLHAPADGGARGLRRHRRRRHGGGRGRAGAGGGRRLRRRRAASRTTPPASSSASRHRACTPPGELLASLPAEPLAPCSARSLPRAEAARWSSAGARRASGRVHQRRVRSPPPRARRVPRGGARAGRRGWWSAVNDDASVRRLKGARRPHRCPRRSARELLAALRVVDLVVAVRRGHARGADRGRLRPDVLVKGGD